MYAANSELLIASMFLRFRTVPVASAAPRIASGTAAADNIAPTPPRAFLRVMVRFIAEPPWTGTLEPVEEKKSNYDRVEFAG
jgi:hypothetical protein